MLYFHAKGYLLGIVVLFELVIFLSVEKTSCISEMKKTLNKHEKTIQENEKTIENVSNR